MTSMSAERWERARQEMLERWRLILLRIERQDEGGVLTLANMMDEFCEVAVEERKAVTNDREDPAVPILKFPPTSDVSGRCTFCRAFSETGGCFGVLHALNKAVLDGSWIAARRVAQQQLERLQTLRFGAGSGQTVH